MKAENASMDNFGEGLKQNADKAALGAGIVSQLIKLSPMNAGIPQQSMLVRGDSASHADFCSCIWECRGK